MVERTHQAIWGAAPPVLESDGVAAGEPHSMRASTVLRMPFGASEKTPGVTVRRPTDLDVPDLARVFSAMQQHYGRPVTDEQAVDAAQVACEPARGRFDVRVLIAVKDGAIAGSIVLNVTFPAFELSRALYIRDLYVVKAFRRQGIGQALVRAAAYLTYSEGFSALDWTTDSGNSAARQMYESCGARLLERTYYRLAREDMEPGS